MLATALAIVGLVLEVFGLGITVVGLRDTWREFGGAAGDFWHELLRAYASLARRGSALLAALLGRVRQSVVRTIRRALRRPTHVRVNAEAALGFAGALDATVIRGYGPLHGANYGRSGGA